MKVVLVVLKVLVAVVDQMPQVYQKLVKVVTEVIMLMKQSQVVVVKEDHPEIQQIKVAQDLVERDQTPPVVSEVLMVQR